MRSSKLCRENSHIIITKINDLSAFEGRCVPFLCKRRESTQVCVQCCQL